MQLTQDTVDKYKQDAPQLLDAVTSGESEHIMKRDPKTDYCIKYDKGWCGIHKEFGTEMLGDACHFFPRSTRHLGGKALMSAALSCPEVTRRVLFDAKPDHDFESVPVDRLPYSIKNYKPDGLDEERALAVHQAFLDAVLDETVAPEHSLMRIRIAVEKLDNTPAETLAVAVPFYIKQADSMMPEAMVEPADPLNLLNTLNALVNAAKATNRDRLMQTIADMETAMSVTLDHEQLTIALQDNTAEALAHMQQRWRSDMQDVIQPIMRRWLYGELSLALFPFSGLGQDAVERITIIAIRYATVRLGLLALHSNQDKPSHDDMIRVVQSLARFMDHLADPTSSLALYKQLGWTQANRLRGVLAI